ENEEQLMSNIENASLLILEVHCGNYFRHMLGFLERCIRKEPIFDELKFNFIGFSITIIFLPHVY
ncbi:hypothetical protein ENBRE01_2974, partial [Enteropsectra breve]